MKNKIIAIFVATFGLLTLNSCEDESDLMISSPTGTFSIKTPLSGESIVLSETTLTNPGLSITWNPMDYTTQASITYTVQIAKDGTDFASPIDLGSTTNLYNSFQTADFNLKCLQSGCKPFEQSAINIRVKATSGTTGSQPSYSNSITYLVTCFGCLNQYAVGSALTQSGWNWNSPRVLLCDNNVLTMTADIESGTGKAFRFFTSEGNWGSGRNYPWYITEGYKVVSTLVNANDGDQNFTMTSPNAKYKVTIDGNNKTINIAKRTGTSELEPTSDWLVGAATPGGWSWAGNNETEFGEVANGVYEVLVKLTQNNTFRVFLGNNGGDSWGLGDRNFPYYTNNGYTIDSELENANDGDSNFKYLGPTAVRRFKIDTNAKTITVD